MRDYAYRSQRYGMRGNKSNSRRLSNTSLHGVPWLRRKGNKGIMLTSILYGLLTFALLAASFSEGEKTAIIAGVFTLLNSFILWKLQHGLNRVQRRVDRVDDAVSERENEE